MHAKAVFLFYTRQRCQNERGSGARRTTVCDIKCGVYYWFTTSDINEHKTEPLGHMNNWNTTMFIKLSRTRTLPNVTTLLQNKFIIISTIPTCSISKTKIQTNSLNLFLLPGNRTTKRISPLLLQFELPQGYANYCRFNTPISPLLVRSWLISGGPLVAFFPKNALPRVNATFMMQRDVQIDRVTRITCTGTFLPATYLKIFRQGRLDQLYFP